MDEYPEENSLGLHTTSDLSLPTYPLASRIKIWHTCDSELTDAICGKSCSMMEFLGEGVSIFSTLGGNATYFFPEVALPIYTALQ